MKNGGSREKGKRGERGVVALLRSLGFTDAARTAQNRGKTGECGDVECKRTLPNLHIEVKNSPAVFPGTARFAAALTQCIRDANGTTWALFWKCRGQWFLTMREHNYQVHATGGSIFLMLCDRHSPALNPLVIMENIKEAEASGEKVSRPPLDMEG